MAGGGNRRDEGSLVINNAKVFVALETLRRRRSPIRIARAPEPQMLWVPAHLVVKSWADVDDEDDDDYYATMASPQAPWGSLEPQQIKVKPNVEESQSEEDILDKGDDDAEEKHDHALKVPVKLEPAVKKPADVPAPPKENLRLSLADFAVAPKGSDIQDDSRGVAQEKDNAPNGDGEKKENYFQGGQRITGSTKHLEATNELSEVTEAEQTEEDTSNIDMKERLKKVVSVKKKKFSKELDAVAKAAAQEVATRRARLAAAKKKEKNHYNQQPVQ
ncbi:nucleolar protein 12 [Pyrus ussuriensis x Pyrus communis]|uniref:Nucleolar protein 12 n=1 Tax=Pyrus ussuriensis x Pyrus communis TaxID=2448454 RepID=A0A5N5HNB4_9ROSA|nr:nucleolar protein 12 [Pyrus ussuriensis x Pyrus communis]